MNDNELLKRHAAVRAVDFVTNGSVIGLGTGTTVRYALEELARRLADGRLRRVVGVPTSERTAELSRRLGIPLTTLDDHLELDLDIDGADEIDPNLNLIKGRGGALVREKVVAAAARELVVIADQTKLVDRLGSKTPLPVEIVPFALPLVLNRLEASGQVILRRSGDGQPFRTDNGNYILDYECGPIADLPALEYTLLRIPGVVGHGLFLAMTRRAVIADADGISVLEQ